VIIRNFIHGTLKVWSFGGIMLAHVDQDLCDDPEPYSLNRQSGWEVYARRGTEAWDGQCGAVRKRCDTSGLVSLARRVLSLLCSDNAVFGRLDF